MALILFGVFIALLLLGVPVAFAICSAAAATMFALWRCQDDDLHRAAHVCQLRFDPA